MANKKLTVIIDGKEYVSKEATKASKSLTGIQKATKGMSSAMKTAVPIAGAVVGAVVAIGAAIKNVTDAYGVQAAADQKLSSALLATKNQLGVTTGELSNYATELSRMTGIADEAIIEAEALMVTFTKIGKEVFPEALERASDMSVMFGQDLQQSVIQLGTALNDPIAGVGRLKRIGISFSEDQKKMIEGFMEQNDIMSAQSVILNELNAEFGGVAENMGDEWPAKTKRFHNAFVDGKEIMGDYAADGLSPLISKLTTFMEKTNDAKKAQKGFNDIWSDEGADGIEDYEQAFIGAQNRINSINDDIEYFQMMLENSGGFQKLSYTADLEEAQKNLKLAMADWESINRILESVKEVNEANAQKNREIAEEAQRILELEELIDSTIADLGDSRQQEIDAVQANIDRLAKYRSEVEYDAELQHAINLLVEKRDKLIKEQADSLKEQNNENDKVILKNRLIDKLIQSATSSYDEQLQALEQIPEIEALIFEAADEGNTAWLNKLVEIKEELYEIAGIDLNTGEVTTTGSDEESSDSINVGGEVGAILDAFAEGGDIWIALINIVLSSLSTFEQFNDILNIVSTLIASLSQTVLMPIFQILQPFLALAQSIVQVVGVMLYPWLKMLVGIIAILTPVLEVVAYAFAAVGAVVAGIGAVFGWLGDWLTYFGKCVSTALYNILHPGKQKSMPSKPSQSLGNAIKTAANAAWTAGTEPLNELDYSTTSYDDLTFGDSTSISGGDTSITQVPDIYIYQTFSNSPIVGAEGLEEFGRFTVDAIQEYAGVGGAVTFMEA